MMTFSIGIKLARAGRGETLGSAGCQPALPSKSARSGMERQEARASLFNLDLARLGFTMPELAEVEYFRRQWNAGIGNRVVKIAQHADKRVFGGTDTRALHRELTGARLLTSEARGNRMAGEILWRARISPSKLASELSAGERDELFRATKFIARESLRIIGPDDSKLPRTWLIHERWRAEGKCPRHKTVLRRATIGGRTTAWCPKCQK